MLRTLYLDMNSYFASVEQQFRPELRGRPVATLPVVAPSGCCVAASVEAKRFGVYTGMRLREAMHRCPDLVPVKTRPRLYIETHHRVLEAIDTVVPVDTVHSIDEVSCSLMANEREPARARAIAQAAKDAIRSRVGEWLRSSVGVAPNIMLAKVASNVRKPDGLTIIEHGDLPDVLLHLDLRALPNIGPKMEARLRAAGVGTMQQLYDQSEHELERIWGGVVGRRWYHLLRGEVVQLPRTHRRSMSHEHVLPPDERDDASALRTLLRLTHKLGARLRTEGCIAGRIGIGVRPDVRAQARVTGEGASAAVPRARRWHAEHRFSVACADTADFIAAVRSLFEGKPDGPSALVSVVVSELAEKGQAEENLFAAPRRREAVWQAVDAINRRFKDQAVFSGAIHGMHQERLGGIAFHSVPSLDLPDTVPDHEEEHAEPS
ncbi:MAG: DNA polymerase [Planctomycetota bacterium]